MTRPAIVTILATILLLSSCEERKNASRQTEGDATAHQARSDESDKLRSFEERRKEREAKLAKELSEIDRQSKREEAKLDLELHRIEAQEKVELAKARLESAKRDELTKLGIDPAPVADPKPSSDPNLPAGVEHATSTGTQAPVDVQIPASGR